MGTAEIGYVGLPFPPDLLSLESSVAWDWWHAARDGRSALACPCKVWERTKNAAKPGARRVKGDGSRQSVRGTRLRESHGILNNRVAETLVTERNGGSWGVLLLTCRFWVTEIGGFFGKCY